MSPQDNGDYQENIQRLNGIIRDIKIGMFTTFGEDGSLHSRPMATQESEFDGVLWFFTAESSPKIDELEFNKYVNITYASPAANRFVSVSGKASVVRDPDKMRELWSPLYKAWFPKGLDDPELALIKVNVEKAEYWDAPSNAAVKLVGFVKAAVTGTSYQAGEHEKVTLVPQSPEP